MKKLIIITGLTGSGKSSLALDIAKRFNGEIISADSVQVYKGLDIGSAKDVDAMREVKHHVIDFKDNKETYNVSEFITDCEKALADISTRNKLPIVVGGTAMYIKALIEGYTLGAKSDEGFRTQYEQIAKEKGNQFVWDELNRIDSTLANAVHPNNLKRVIRYLELATLGKNAQTQESILKGYDYLLIGITSDRNVIYDKINKRVDIMINDGLMDEVRRLIDSGVTRNCQSVNSIGYKEWFDYFDNKQDLQTTIQLIKQHTRNYCKRQQTFMKTIKNINMLTISEAKQRIEEFLND